MDIETVLMAIGGYYVTKWVVMIVYKIVDIWQI